MRSGQTERPERQTRPGSTSTSSAPYIAIGCGRAEFVISSLCNVVISVRLTTGPSPHAPAVALAVPCTPNPILSAERTVAADGHLSNASPNSRLASALGPGRLALLHGAAGQTPPSAPRTSQRFYNLLFFAPRSPRPADRVSPPLYLTNHPAHPVPSFVNIIPPRRLAFALLSNSPLPSPSWSAPSPACSDPSPVRLSTSD